eukprot:2842761-Amphidinium_carterae.1
MVVAVYGVLIAGGAYVPLEPQYPKARILSIVEQVHMDQNKLSREFHKRQHHVNLDEVDERKLPCRPAVSVQLCAT